jgi:hypothetical protein
LDELKKVEKKLLNEAEGRRDVRTVDQHLSKKEAAN